MTAVSSDAIITCNNTHMNINIKATNTTLTPSVDDYIRKKVAALEKYIPAEDTSAQVAVEVGKATSHHKTGDVFFAEFNVHIAGKDFYAHREAGDIFAAIDIVKDEVLEALRTYKDKRKTLFRRGSQAVKDLLHGINFKRKK